MIDFSSIVAVIIGVVEVFKRTGMDSRYAPALSIILGIITYGFLGTDVVSMNIFTGVIAGLTSCGLYSGTKKTVQG